MSKILETCQTGHNRLIFLNTEKYRILKVREWLLKQRIIRSFPLDLPLNNKLKPL
jgi:hypothetical protein